MTFIPKQEWTALLQQIFSQKLHPSSKPQFSGSKAQRCHINSCARNLIQKGNINWHTGIGTLLCVYHRRYESNKILLQSQRSCKKVIFSVVSVIMFKGEGRHLVTITDDALDLIVQAPLALIHPDVKHGTPLFTKNLLPILNLTTLSSDTGWIWIMMTKEVPSTCSHLVRSLSLFLK